MGRILGRGRYIYGTYESTGSGGSAGAAGVPLSRQRFIDGDTVQAGLNGAAAEPFKTIAQFMASRGNDSIADATANYVGWLMPSLAGYSENIAFPPYVSTELLVASVSLLDGTAITGNVTWANAAGPFAATTAVVSLFNARISGNFTVTDDVNAPDSIVSFGGDSRGGALSASLGGAFSSTAAAHLVAVIFENATVGGNIDCGASPASADLGIFTCICAGAIAAKSLAAFDSTFASSAITVDSNGQMVFHGCRFTASAAIDCAAGASFDGSSWQSFVEAGGVRVIGTPVLVVGGYDGGDVPGAALTGASTSVSLNGTGAVTAGYTGRESGNHYSTSNGTPTTVTLLTDGALPGDTLLITKTDLGANVLAVVNGGIGAGTIGTIPTNARGFVLARFDGTNWLFAEGGSMLA